MRKFADRVRKRRAAVNRIEASGGTLSKSQQFSQALLAYENADSIIRKRQQKWYSAQDALPGILKQKSLQRKYRKQGNESKSQDV